MLTRSLEQRLVEALGDYERSPGADTAHRVALWATARHRVFDPSLVIPTRRTSFSGRAAVDDATIERFIRYMAPYYRSRLDALALLRSSGVACNESRFAAFYRAAQEGSEA